MHIVFSGTELKDGEPIAPLINAARRHGGEWLELWYPKNLVLEGVDATLDQLASAGLRVAAVVTGTELGNTGDPAPHQDLMIKALDLAHRIGCGLVGTYFGYRPDQDDNSSIEAYVKNVAPCVERAEALGVTLTLENEFDCFGRDRAGSDPTRRPEAIVRLMERVRSPRFRLTFDPCNAYFAGLEPFPWFYDAVRPYVGYVHVKDGGRSNGAAHPAWIAFTDHGRRYITCPLGEGALNWPGLLRALARDSYNGFLTLEPHGRTEHRDAAWDHAASTLSGWLKDIRPQTSR